jgi:cytochrome c556
MKKLCTFVLAACAACVAIPASAQFAKPEDAVKYRQSSFFILQQNFARVAGMAAGKIPFDAKVAAESAVVSDFVAKLPWAAFGSGTDKGDSKAKPEIWSNKAKFDDYANKLQAELAKLDVAAKTGSLDNIKVAVNGAAATCKSCHEDFKNR